MSEEPIEALPVAPLDDKPVTVPATMSSPPRSEHTVPASPAEESFDLQATPVEAVPVESAKPPAQTGAAPADSTGVAKRPVEEWLTPPRPELAQALRNLRVWLPFLANPVERGLQMRYAPDLNRVGLAWKVIAPRMCWHCGQDQALQQKQLECTLRSFEYPIPLIVGTAATALIALLIALAWWLFGGILFLLVILIGGVVLWLKSWQEEVRLSFWTCQEHSSPMIPPGLVIDDQQLYIYFAHADVVEAAKEELQERRRGEAGRKAMGSTGAAPAPAPKASSTSETVRPAPSRPTSAKPVDLPPIKLEGDE